MLHRGEGAVSIPLLKECQQLDASKDSEKIKLDDDDLFDELECDLLDDPAKATHSDEWIPYTDPAGDGDGPFYLNKSLFEKGLVVFSDRPEEDISEEKFPFGSRNFKFTTLDKKEDKDKSQIMSSARIFSQLHLFTKGSSIEVEEKIQSTLKDTLEQVLNPQEIKEHITKIKSSEDMINIIYESLSESPDLTKDKNNLSIITTEARSDEVFFPFGFIDKVKSTPTGLYIYPWLSLTTVETQIKENFIQQFKGLTDFFTGSRLFGSALKGIDEYQNSISLIKADLQLYPKQKITKINYEAALQLHEIVQIRELKKQASLVACLASAEEKKPNSSKESKGIMLYHHLPGYDYLLIGVELYIKGYMTLSAFESFCYVVLKRQATYVHIIKKISLKYGVKIFIVTPFEFIFNKLPKINFSEKSYSGNEAKALGEAVLTTLNITTLVEVKPSISEEKLTQERVRVEQIAVGECLALIKKKNNPANVYSTVWNDFIENAGKTIRTLKDLSHIGNTVMIGIIAYNKQPLSVCALHPVSEEYIFLQYAQYIERKNKQQDMRWKKAYPLILCCSTMDSVQPHSKLYKENQGQTFYYNRRAEFLVHAKELNLLERAGINVGYHGSCPPPSPSPSRLE